jgi:hypothetical protein
MTRFLSVFFLGLSLLGGVAVADEVVPPAAVPAAAVAMPPEGWWVPATLKLPKAAAGRIAWRFTLREVITIDKDGQLERRPAALTSPRPGRFETPTPQPMVIELDDRQHTLTVTMLKPQAAFFTLNPAGTADRERFDKLVINVHADSADVQATCDKAARCARRSGHDELLPSIEEKTPTGQRSLTGCRDALSTLRQELAASHHSIPAICR